MRYSSWSSYVLLFCNRKVNLRPFLTSILTEYQLFVYGEHLVIIYWTSWCLFSNSFIELFFSSIKPEAPKVILPSIPLFRKKNSVNTSLGGKNLYFESEQIRSTCLSYSWCSNCRDLPPCRTHMQEWHWPSWEHCIKQHCPLLGFQIVFFFFFFVYDRIVLGKRCSWLKDSKQINLIVDQKKPEI